ncbi:MAG: C40 family peptidase [Verrucomicrobia bacterium]|nr:C40 family peptidase [Verrucomicrobiota bacterium]
MFVYRPVVNVYVNPEEDTEVHTQAFYSNAVEILEKGDWSRIRMIDGEEGWVKSSCLHPEYNLADPLIRPVKSLFAHIYRVPDTTPFPPLMTLPYGAKIKLQENFDPSVRWIPIELIDGKKAWIQRGDVDFEPRLKTMEELIPFALKFLGLPYTWGGTTSFGYDCSGFIQMLFREAGYLIPRNARSQIHWSGFEPVHRKDLQPCDLLFFGEERINHVGLYLDKGQFLHAGVRDEVHAIGISSLEKTKYNYAAARRMNP